MRFRVRVVFLCLSAFFIHATRGNAQQTKEELIQKMAQEMCPVFEKALAEQKGKPLTKDQYMKVITQGYAPIAGKEMASIKRLYGAEVLGNTQAMNQIGSEVGAQLLQDCPSFIELTRLTTASPQSSAATTGQSTGKLGALQGTGVATLQMQLSKGEKAEFVWLSRFPGAEELLPQLGSLQGRQARISWQEVDLYQPQEKRFVKVREITGIELQ